MLRNTSKLFGAIAEEWLLFSSNIVHHHICILYFYKKQSSLLLFFVMKPTCFANPSASKGEFLEPSPVSKQNHSSGYELHPGLIAMVWARPFLGHENENPCHHLQDFEEMCSCLSISCMTQETLRWALFPFSLIEKAKNGTHLM
jgi:hypothetical protein